MGKAGDLLLYYRVTIKISSLTCEMINRFESSLKCMAHCEHQTIKPYKAMGENEQLVKPLLSVDIQGKSNRIC